MLSDEERKAIEKLSAKKNESTWNDTIRQIKREEIKDVVVTRQKYITTVLNLIEKQSKEIEELHKEINQRIKLKLENERCADEDFIYKDKIKAKIEEVNNGTYDAKIVLQSLLEKE